MSYMPTITARLNVYGSNAEQLYKSAADAAKDLAGRSGTVDKIELTDAAETQPPEGETATDRGRQWGAVAVITVSLPAVEQPIVVPSLAPDEDAPRS